ncbi:MAG: hypothetical protein KDB80_10710, partial [Planctomycetes bacterium]|nr:hypothetical protein [Planctomycetota bacterium]
MLTDPLTLSGADPTVAVLVGTLLRVFTCPRAPLSELLHSFLTAFAALVQALSPIVSVQFTILVA